MLKLALGGTDSNMATQAFACWKSQVIAAQEQAPKGCLEAFKELIPSAGGARGGDEGEPEAGAGLSKGWAPEMAG